MDDDDFDDLLAGVDDFPGSSQESLTNAAAKLDIDMASSQSTKVQEQTISRDDAKGQHEIATLSQSIDEVTDTQVRSSAPMSVAEKIESVFKEIADALASPKGQMSLTLRARPSVAGNVARSRHVRFPGKTAEEAWRFTVVTRIMELMYDAIRSDVVLSKRDVYYRDPALFGSQAAVDRYVDIIAYTLNVPRAMLYVTAAAKGLVAGAFRICRRDGSVADAASDKGGLLVPMLREVLSVNMSAVNWVLVIEKEASFRSIAASSFWEDVSTRGVIMTGKGYPDITTRALLHFMTAASPQNGFASPPVFCLVDFDPDGLAIMSTYKNGSMALAHENEDLRVAQMQWLGLRSEHLCDRADGLHGEQGLLTLTPRDRRKAIGMLERGKVDPNNAHELEVRTALQAMLMLNTKAELQLLDATPRGMTDLLTSALSCLG